MTPKPPAPPPAPPDDPDSPPSEEEIAQSDALRRALEDPSIANEAADLARAASLAHAPRPIDPSLHRKIVETALVRRPARGGRLIRVSFGVGAALALAAGVVFVIGSPENERPASAPLASMATVASKSTPLIRVRSTQPLFEEPFTAHSSGSARIDRIAMARASDFRENEFARWGAR
jgi:hypothetical protein